MDHYYVNQPDYFELVEIRNCIIGGNISSAIDKVQTVNPNGYVRGTKQGTWVPILYFACLSEKNDALVKVLLKAGADPRLRPDDTDHPEPLIFHCNAMYLQFLVQKGCTYYDNINNDIIKRLHCGDHKRLISLVKLNIITNSQICEALAQNDVILTCLKTLTKYIVHIHSTNTKQIQQNQYNVKEETSKVIKQYFDTCAYIINFNTAYITKESIEYATAFYIYEILLLFKDKLKDDFPKALTIKYHEQMDPLTVAITRPLLNDGRYCRTCEIINVIPSRDLSDSIYV
jgi:hypothetical protein